MNLIKRFDEITETEIDLVGGKGLSIARLADASLPVPPGFVITTEAYEELKGKDIPYEVQADIFQAFDNLGAERVAVRSSAIAEDSLDASWAGQFESYLNITKDSLLEAIQKCWHSTSSDTVKDYAEGQSEHEDQLAVAVIVQKMVDSEVSGVAFSVNPVSKNHDEIMIEAIYGLGELLVQGMITPDNYIFSKTSQQIIDKQIKTKPVMMVYANGQNTQEPVQQEKREASCLDDSQIIELAQLVASVEDYYKSPQDIEWAYQSGMFYIVQSRPITTL